MSGKKIAIAAILINSVLASAVAAISKKGLEEIPPMSFAFMRFIVASVCILPFFLHLKGHKISQMRELVPVSFFATGNIIFFILGVYLTKANIASIIYAAVPLLTGVILYIFFREKLSTKKQLGIFIGFLGVLFIAFLPVLEKGNPFSGNLFGNVLLAIAVISWSFYMVYSKKLQNKYSPFLITYNFIFVSTIMLFPFFLWDLLSNFGWWQHVGGWGVFAVLYMAIPATVFSNVLGQYTIKHGGTVFAGTMFYIMPVFGFGINFLLLGEILTPGFIFGSILALLGTYLVVRR